MKDNVILGLLLALLLELCCLISDGYSFEVGQKVRIYNSITNQVDTVELQFSKQQFLRR